MQPIAVAVLANFYANALSVARAAAIARVEGRFVVRQMLKHTGVIYGVVPAYKQGCGGIAFHIIGVRPRIRPFGRIASVVHGYKIHGILKPRAVFAPFGDEVLYYCHDDCSYCFYDIICGSRASCVIC